VQNIGAYGAEVSESIVAVECYDLLEKRVIEIPADLCEFGYRSSVFKRRPELVVMSVIFRLHKSAAACRSWLLPCEFPGGD
jgi:UDP-N-acetylmuramate dehydrogenase